MPIAHNSSKIQNQHKLKADFFLIYQCAFILWAFSQTSIILWIKSYQNFQHWKTKIFTESSKLLKAYKLPIQGLSLIPIYCKIAHHITWLVMYWLSSQGYGVNTWVFSQPYKLGSKIPKNAHAIHYNQSILSGRFMPHWLFTVLPWTTTFHQR